jgi:hypothetical protein
MSARQAYQRDPRVDAYFGRLPVWQRRLCQELRDLIHRVGARGSGQAARRASAGGRRAAL